MIYKIAAGFTFIITAILAYHAFLKGQNESIPFIEKYSWSIPALIFVVCIAQITGLFKRNDTKRLEDKIDDLQKTINEFSGDQHIYLNGLLETQNSEIQDKLFKANEQLKRVAAIDKARESGNQEVRKQKEEATLKAIEYYKQGSNSNPTVSEKLALLNLLGNAYLRISLLSDAEEAYNKMIEDAEGMIFSENEEYFMEGQIFLLSGLGNLGIISKIRGDYDKAFEMYQKSLDISNRHDIKEAIADACTNIGNIYAIRCEFDNAMNMYQHALNINLELENKVGIANYNLCVGIIYKTQGEFDKALDAYSNAQNIYIEVGNKEGIAMAFSNMGAVYRMGGNLDDALSMYQKALDIETEIGSMVGIAADYANMGVVYGIREEFEKALEMIQKSLEITIELNNKETMAVDYGNMGNYYRMLGDLENSMKSYFKALNINTELGRKEGMAIQNFNIGNLKVALDKTADAKAYFEKSLKLFKEIGAKDGISKVGGLLRDLEAEEDQ